MSTTEDIYSLQLLRGLLDGPYLPFATSSLRPLYLANILNDIVINGRESVLEFGSGISTILIGRLARKNNLPIKVLSVDHLDFWVEGVQEQVRKEGLEDIISLIHAPLKPCAPEAGTLPWYDTDIITAHTGDRLFDLVIIDGPPAYETSKKEARYPAYPFIADRLAQRSSVYLDDADREGEKVILQRWEEEYAVRFRVVGGGLAHTVKGPFLNAEVF